MQPLREAEPEPPGARRTVVRPARGFPLIELLIVLALLIVMYVLYFSRSADNRQSQLKAQCALNLQNVYVALETCTLEHKDAFPLLSGAQTSEPPLSLLVPKYTSVTGYFICPGPGEGSLPEARPFADRRISYAYYMGRTSKSEPDQPLITDAQINTRNKEKGQPLFSADGKKPGNNHHRYGGNVMLCDGRIEASRAKAAFALTATGQVVLLNPRP
jgi:type II secretory pathway pseudopilin PulG